MTPGNAPTPHDPLIRSLAHALRRRCNVREGDNLLLAVSGGADSVALLRALAILAPRRRWQLQLTIAHIHHHLRDQADDDADFVERLASQLNLPFLLEHIRPADQPGNLERSARMLRYDALASLARQRDAAVVTAHQADDQLETLLMRMIRGTSIRGLRGIRWKRRLPLPHQPTVTVTLIRPMLALGREQIETWLRAIDQPWREDHTNADTTRWRARLRHQVLPVLRDLRPDAPRRAVELTDHLAALCEHYQHTIEQARRQAVQQSGPDTAIDRPQLRHLPRPILTGLLRELLIERGAREDRLGASRLNTIAHAVSDSKGGRRCFTIAGDPAQLITIGRERITIAHAT